MILLREVQERDVESLLELAQIPGFINLPDNRDQLIDKVEHAIRSMNGQVEDLASLKYMFVAEDLENHKILGTSMIARQHGTPDEPHFYFEVGKEQKFSETINTGFIHGTLQLKTDMDGPAELGGLVVDERTRGSRKHVGRQISFVRFLFLAIHRHLFRDRIIAELLPPLNKTGQSPLWEAIGRRFTNMNYWEADEFSRKNKEFILDLFPTEKIYTTFLEPEAREAIGRVGKATEPVFHMLTKIGFEYRHQVDPFDGGPHLWADIDKIVPVRKAKRYSYVGLFENESFDSMKAIDGLLSAVEEQSGTFRAAAVSALTNGGELYVTSKESVRHLEKHLHATRGAQVWFMPYY